MLRSAIGTLCAAVAVATAVPAGARSFCIVSVEEDGGDLAILDSAGKRLASVPVGSRPHEVEVSADGRTAFVSQFGITDYDSRIGTPGDRVVAIDLRRARAVGSLIVPAGLGAPHGVKLRPGRRHELFVNAEAGGDTMLVFDIASRRLLRRFALPKLTHNFIFSNNGRSLFSFAGVDGISRIDADTGRIIAALRLPTPVRGLRLDGEGSLLAAARGRIYRLVPETLAIRDQLDTAAKGQLVYLESLGQGRIAAPSLDDGGIIVVGPHSESKFIATGKTPIFVRRAPDGRLFVANVDDDHLTVMDDRGNHLASFGHLRTPNGLGFGACPAGR